MEDSFSCSRDDSSIDDQFYDGGLAPKYTKESTTPPPNYKQEDCESFVDSENPGSKRIMDKYGSKRLMDKNGDSLGQKK